MKDKGLLIEQINLSLDLLSISQLERVKYLIMGMRKEKKNS